MKVNWQLFGGLGFFYVLVTIIYWQVGGEPVGIGGMLLGSISGSHRKESVSPCLKIISPQRSLMGQESSDFIALIHGGLCPLP